MKNIILDDIIYYVGELNQFNGSVNWIKDYDINDLTADELIQLNLCLKKTLQSYEITKEFLNKRLKVIIKK